MARYAIFQKIISILVIINLVGCASIQPIEAQPDELQNRIRHENLVKVGDNVRIFTEDGKEHGFRVTSVDENEIIGVRLKSNTENEIVEEIVRIPVESIIALETKEVSIGKTVLLGYGILGVWVAIGMLIAASSIAFMP
jgi:hypothetical protein